MENGYRNCFDALFELPRDIMVWLDHNGQIINVNQRVLEVTGFRKEELVGRRIDSLSDIFFPESQAKILDSFTRRQRGELLEPYEVAIHNKTGEKLFFELSANPLRGEAGEALGEMVILRDIKRHKQAEAELRSAMEFSDKLISAAPNIIVGLGAESEIMVFNQFAEQLTGYSAEEVLGRSWIDTFIPEAARPEIKALWEKIVAQRLIQHHFENPILTKDGRERLIAWNNTVLTEGQEFKMVISVGEDVTELRQLDQAKETLFRNVSHKLKSPLAMMTMGMDLLRSGLAKKDELKTHKAVDLISKHLAITSRDINSIITFFTLSAGLRSLPKETVSLNAIIKEVIYDLQPLAEEQQVALSNDLPLNELEVAAVSEELRILFHNLVENAVKFTERGEVTISAKAADPMVTVFIRDTGRGLSRAELERLGKEFYQHNPEVKGLGLGLAISQEIARRHGGEVRIDSPGTGKGAIVTVILPTGT